MFSYGMWNLKRLPSNVLIKVNLVFKENVRMASKKAVTDEKPKATKKNFFQRSESVMPDSYNKTSESSNIDSKLNDSDKRVIRRSSMICSEGFDKYTFDCHRQDIPSKSAGLELETVNTSDETIYNQNPPLFENNAFAYAQSSKPVSVEQTAVKKITSFKPLSALSVVTSAKNAPVPFKRVPEETIPANMSLSYKRVPEETVPAAKTLLVNTTSGKSPVTTIPLSFSPLPEETNWAMNTSSLKTSPIKSAPVMNSPFSFKSTSEESAPMRNAPLSVRHIPEKSRPVSKAFSFKSVSEQSTSLKNDPLQLESVSSEFAPSRTPLYFRHVPEKTVSSNYVSDQSSPLKNALSPHKSVSDEFAPSRNTPLSFRHIPEETVSSNYVSDQSTPLKNAPLSHKSVSDDFAPSRSTPLSFRHIPEKTVSSNYVPDQSTPLKNAPSPHKSVSDEFAPSRSTPLSFRHIPEKNVSSDCVSDEPIPVRSSPLSLKGESISLRNIPSTIKHFSNEPSTPIRNIPLALQPVPEEPAIIRDSSSLYKYIPDEPIPFRNSPLSLKPLTKHISLLRKKSLKTPIIKRDSVVHPERIDMQGSLLIEGRFQNPWPTWRPPTFANILKFGVTRNKSKVPPKQELDLVLPIVKQNFSKLSIPDDGIRVTWIGHSTVLLQMHGLNVLTDPIFSDRASPSQVVGPKRYRDPPCTIHDLPHINAVVISHSHYDHLDNSTVTLLNARFGSEIRWFVPLGLQTWMEDIGCENVVELDWWEENCVPEHSDTFFVFTPAQHWSKRTIGDDNKVLWGSWCILGPKYKFFFAGDTGYCDVFKQIGRVHGPFDLSAIPIGAYEPRWFMKYQHVNPEEAVKIHMDVKSKRSLAIHWGTFSLANEYYLDPPVRLRESLDKCEIPPELFFTLKHGESRLISQNNLVKKNPLSERNTNVS